MRHLIDIKDLSKAELDDLLALGMDIKANPQNYRESARFKKLATLFFEPSTRTRLSFEAAMLDLGGNVIGFSESSSSSVTKGESVRDTIRTVGCYTDIIAMRHPLEGAPLMAADTSPVPVINAGDGGHCHPTQTLTDLLTILDEKGQVDGLTIGMCGDLKYGRTVHSLINALEYYKNVRIALISPESLALPEYIKQTSLKGTHWEEYPNIEAAMDKVDVLYMTRIQRERFSDPSQYAALEGGFILTPELMKKAKGDAIVLHPLPRVDEISTAVDEDSRAAYFRQMKNGKFVRMALLMTLLSGKLMEKSDMPEQSGAYICENKRCITNAQRDAEHVFIKSGDGVFRCKYCEQKPGIEV